MNYWEKLSENIKKHLGQIPYIILSPVAIIIQLLHELTVTPYNALCQAIKEKTFSKSRTQRILQKTVSSILHGHSNILNTFQNRRIARMFTFLLQCISFITTYAGFTFFLGSVNPIAPLFMAITVQGACYYLLNYTSSKKHGGGWKRGSLLFVLMAISVLTSYMGIFDSVVKPVDQMSAQYDSYAKAVNSIIDDEIAANYSYEISHSEIEKIFNQFQTSVGDTDAIISILNDTNSQTKTTQTIPTSWIDENNVVRYGTKIIPLEGASNDIVKNKTKISILTNYKTKISDFLSKGFSSKDVFEAIKSILENPEKLEGDSDSDKEVYNQFIMAVGDLNDLNKKLTEDINSQTADFNIDIDNAIKNSQKRQKLNDLKPTKYEELTFEKTVKGSLEDAGDESKFLSTLFGFFEKLNKFVVSKDLTEAETIRETLTKKSEKSYAEIYPLLSTENKTELEKYKKYTIYENTQIMPFKSPFNKDNQLVGEAIFAFAVALLVDLLSLLISWALVVKSKSILYYNNVRDVRKYREEMIEDCLMYICLDGMSDQPKKSEDIQKYAVDKVRTTMNNFLANVKYIYLPDELNSFGYLSFDDIKQDDNNQKLLFQALNNAALLQPFHKSELSIILKNEIEASNEADSSNIDALLEKYDTYFDNDKIYYLVSKNLHFWFCENFSELLQNTKIYDDLSGDN